MNSYRDNETYKIIGICMDVYNNLGSGFLEIVYKEALELEFNENQIPFEREKEYSVNYKGRILNHKFYADFIVFNNVILEIKCTRNITDEHIAQTINYLKVSSNRIALIVNFGENRLNYRRVINSK